MSKVTYQPWTQKFPESLFSCHDKSNAQQAIECQERIREDAELNQIAETKNLTAVPVNGDECIIQLELLFGVGKMPLLRNKCSTSCPAKQIST